MKKIALVLIILLAIAGAVVTVRMFSGPEDGWVCQEGDWVKHGNPDSPRPDAPCGKDDGTGKDNPVIGGDRDEHDCLGPAGYSWCPSTGKCQKMWEEYCPEFKDQFRITDFNSCVAAGHPVAESYPRTCAVPGGETFTESLGNSQEKESLIRLAYPRPNDKIASPLVVAGQARGGWFFEGTFPVSLVDWDGLIIAEGNAVAEGDWMSADFVPFKAELTFKRPELYNRGSLILQKSNPSDLPQNDDALEIPILFAD